MNTDQIQSKSDLEQTAKNNGFKNVEVSDEEYEKYKDWMRQRED